MTKTTSMVYPKMLAYMVVGGLSTIVVLGGCYELAIALLDPLTPFWSPALSPYPRVEAYVYPVGVIRYTPSLTEIASTAAAAVLTICLGLWGCRFAVRRFRARRTGGWSA